MATIPASDQGEILSMEHVAHPGHMAPTQHSGATTPMDLIRVAVENNYDLDKLDRLMDMERRWRADRAKEAFEDAMAAFKLEPIHITKDKINKQYSSDTHKARYTSLGNLVATVTPFLSKHGLSAAWAINQPDGKITVSCTITHRLGHSKDPVSVTAPPDISGSKNPLQQIKSSITYAKVCTFESSCGLASSDANLDDDGAGSSTETVKLDNLNERLEWIANSRNKEELMKFYKAAYNDALKLDDKDSMRAILAAKDARKKELGI